VPGLEDIEMLGLLVQADEEAGDPQTWVMTYTGEGRVLVGVQGWPDDVEPLSEHEIDDLTDRGWVRISKSAGKARTYAVTGDGRRAWREWVAHHQHVPGQVNLGWPAARQLLERLHQMYVEAGSPEIGISVLELTQNPETGQQAQAAIRTLFRNEYLEEGFASSDQLVLVRTDTPKTLQLLEGWPSGPAQDALDELVRDLDTAIEQTPDEERRSKLLTLRDGLVGAGRDIALAYFEKKVIGI